MATTTRQRASRATSEVRWAQVEVVPDEAPLNETPVVVRVGEFRVEVSGDFSSETLAAVVDVLEGLQR
jgi:hypothetical protein